MRGCASEELESWACVAAWLDVAVVRQLHRCSVSLSGGVEQRWRREREEHQRRTENQTQVARSAAMVLVTLRGGPGARVPTSPQRLGCWVGKRKVPPRTSRNSCGVANPTSGRTPKTGGGEQANSKHGSRWRMSPPGSTGPRSGITPSRRRMDTHGSRDGLLSGSPRGTRTLDGETTNKSPRLLTQTAASQIMDRETPDDQEQLRLASKLRQTPWCKDTPRCSAQGEITVTFATWHPIVVTQMAECSVRGPLRSGLRAPLQIGQSRPWRGLRGGAAVELRAASSSPELV